MEMFYHPEVNAGSRVVLDRDESQHLRALRIREGEEILLTDGLGSLGVCRVEWSRNEAVAIVSSVKKSEPRKYPLTLAVAPTKSMERNEWMIEKAIEVGVDRIVFIGCDTSERKIIKHERIHRVAVAALKQSRRTFLPKIEGIVSFTDWVMEEDAGTKCIGWCEEAGTTELSQVLAPGKSLRMAIGPEGDFTPGEIQLAKENGFVAVSLGIHRLRTETAALYAAVAFNFIQEES